MSIDEAHLGGNSLAVSMGDPAGIGPDLILDLWINRQALSLPDFFVVGSQAVMQSRASLLKLEHATIDGLPIFDIGAQFSSTIGRPDPNNGAGIIKCIEVGVDLVLASKASGLVTAPINKKALYDCGFDFPGHTEFLAHLCNRHAEKKYRPVMMITAPQLRVVPVTIHIPIAEVPTALTHDLIVETCQVAHWDLKDKFGIENPRLALSGLNPHAGEEGAIGREELDTIVPALQWLKNKGISVQGPLPADTMFHERARQHYDVAICMYHDQALVPVKTLGFDEGVNVTLGLPIIRTSPDHGTAYDLAGSGQAHSTSFAAALKMAAHMANHASQTQTR